MKTIIQIEKETAKNLKNLKSTKLETYDEIIKRLIKNATNKHYTTKAK